MAEGKHTPGPWSVRGISMEDGSISIGSEKYRIVIAYATNAVSFGDFVYDAVRGRRDFGAPDTAQTQWANARLIAATPDLLENGRKLANDVGGLKAFEAEIRAIIGNTNWSVLMQRRDEVDAAIAKAEGRS